MKNMKEKILRRLLELKRQYTILNKKIEQRE